MRDYDIRKLSSEADLAAALEVLRELRTGLSAADFEAMRAAAGPADGYTLVGAVRKGPPERCVAVMGYRVLHDLVHGRHLYIDDLVVAGSERSRGIGAVLLKEAEVIARAERCRGLRLCTGFENEAGRRFYEREGWTPRSLVFKKFPA